MSEVKKYEDGYPAMRYKASSEPRGFESVIVNSPDEEMSLGSGWHNNPGHCLPGAEACSCSKPEPAPRKSDPAPFKPEPAPEDAQPKRIGKVRKAFTPE